MSVHIPNAILQNYKTTVLALLLGFQFLFNNWQLIYYYFDLEFGHFAIPPLLVARKRAVKNNIVVFEGKQYVEFFHIKFDLCD